MHIFISPKTERLLKYYVQYFFIYLQVLLTYIHIYKEKMLNIRDNYFNISNLLNVDKSTGCHIKIDYFQKN